MNSHSFFCWARFAIAAMLVSGIVRAEPSPKRATIVVNAGPLRNDKGSLICRLHSSPDGFPRTGPAIVVRRVKITGSSARCEFENVAPGSYAVVVLHDENDNRQCDRNRLGMPLEGYGVSNNHTYPMSAPKWQESKFAVESGVDRALAISLRY